MPQHILAAILIQLDQPHPGKQEILCIEYALASKLDVYAVTNNVPAAVSMVVAGTVAAIITVLDPGGTLADDLAQWGGQLHIVRSSPPRRRDALEARILGSGLDTHQIATLLQVPPEEVRRRRQKN